MRDRLIALIQNAVGGCARHWAELIADHLLANGVIVPPCKEGDTVYAVFSPPRPANPNDKGKWFMDSFEVSGFGTGVRGLSIKLPGYGRVSEKEIGKTIFLTREDAEKALEEAKND